MARSTKKPIIGIQQLLRSATSAMKGLEWQMTDGRDLLVEDYERLEGTMETLLFAWDQIETEFSGDQDIPCQNTLDSSAPQTV